MAYTIDLTGVENREQLHARLRETLELPAWYGNNLDALHDVLTEGGERELVFRNADAAAEEMRAYIARLRGMLEETAAETPGLTVRWETVKSPFLARAEELRNDPVRHYNCAQGVVVPFAEAAGLDEEAAYRLAANFGGGMKRASTCGAITGGLMVLGLFGVEDGLSIAEYYRRLKDNHEGFLDCADLLRINKQHGGEKKEHCDGMVYECVALAEQMLRERGRL